VAIAQDTGIELFAVNGSLSITKEIIMGSKDKRKESKGKKPQPKPVPAGK
jgi:hypothetical protein